MRFTSRSPSFQVPAAAAALTVPLPGRFVRSWSMGPSRMAATGRRVGRNVTSPAGTNQRGRAVGPDKRAGFHCSHARQRHRSPPPVRIRGPPNRRSEGPGAGGRRPHPRPVYRAPAPTHHERMIPMERAIALVEQVMAREEADSPRAEAHPMVAWKAERHALGWLVFVQSPVWVRTRDSRDMLLGVGPYLVDAGDGSVHTINVVAYRMDEWGDDCRYRVQGLPRPGAPGRPGRNGRSCPGGRGPSRGDAAAPQARTTPDAEAGQRVRRRPQPG
ncbi:YrhB domain-containing protein [Streptomyces sp. PmtA]|uniref:YrhB domain-containing protein n=1 Tax=Streptomyces sp. PmtA TaxID=3074275 RepID=UPI003FCD160E